MKIHFIGQNIFAARLAGYLSRIVEITGITTNIAVESDDYDLSRLQIAPSRYGLDDGWIISQNPDYIVVVGWHKILKKTTLDIAPVIGYHPCPLPKGRGCSPIIWAIAGGWKETGSSFFWMDEGIDTGPIINQEIVAIKEKTAKELYMRLIRIAEDQLKDIVDDLKKGVITKLPQDESEATYLRKRIKGEDKWIKYW